MRVFILMFIYLHFSFGDFCVPSNFFELLDVDPDFFACLFVIRCSENLKCFSFLVMVVDSRGRY